MTRSGPSPLQADPIVVVGAKRTPMGGFQGELSGLRAPELGGSAIAAAIEQAGLGGEEMDEVVMGCVLQAGIGQAPARQAAFAAGLPSGAGGTTVNKMCGSGMKATMLAHDLLAAGTNDVIVCGGMESMSNAPYLLAKARQGYRIGHQTLIDHMFCDGLEDPFGSGGLMGSFAEQCAGHYQFTRDDQDDFAVESLTRARRASDDGTFEREIAPVRSRERETPVETDEQPRRAEPEKIRRLPPAFREGGTVTAANASSISDGAAALVLMRASRAEERGLAPMARILGHSTHAQDPAWFTTAPIGAIARLLERLDLTVAQVDLFEINEAFAVVTMAAMRDLGIGHDKVNVHGGACALGHPIGASGARLLVTLLNALEQHDLDRGVASLCIGGGEATAMALERIR